MLENFKGFFKKFGKKEEEDNSSGEAAKERLHLVLMQDRANVSADFLDMMKQEIIDVIKKYIDIDEEEMDVRLTNQIKDDGTNGAPALYANIPIIKIKTEKKNVDNHQNIEDNKNQKDNVIESILKNNEISNKEDKKSEKTEDKDVKDVVNKKKIEEGQRINIKNEDTKILENENIKEDKDVIKVVKKVKSDDDKETTAKTVTKVTNKTTGKPVSKTTSKTTVKPAEKKASNSTSTKKSASSKATKMTTSKR